MTLLNDFFTIVSQSDDAYQVEFNPSHVIYQAHFPGNPVTPGVCIIQTIVELLEQRLGCPLALRCVTNVKFVAPISPLTSPRVDVRFSSVAVAEGQVKARGTIADGNLIVTKFSLLLDQ